MLAGHWMSETKHVGMQTETAHRVLIAAILAVTDNRVSKIGHMDTNLVLSSCL